MLPVGIYRFSGTGDDGIRVLVDNVVILDRWRDQSAPFSVDKVILAGQHRIQVEYYESEVDARLAFTFERVEPVVAATTFQAEYFTDRHLTGVPAVTRVDERVDFDWGGDAPALGIPADEWSARWSQSTVFNPGTYEFTVTGDDGVRLYLDGILTLDQWFDQPATTHQVTRILTGGTHLLTLEYYDSLVDAAARLSYRQLDLPPPPAAQFTGEYYANQNLTAPATLTRTDPAVDFTWDDSSPAGSIPLNEFSVRWTRTEALAAGTYRVAVRADDGVRVFVDGRYVIDAWDVGNRPRFGVDVPFTSFVDLAAGEHTVVIEYFEDFGAANVTFALDRM